ncbi:protein Hezron [Drosophila rhopaloa]|uniref:Protein LSM12 homolog B n=1 Tax=Drosophila rhopaloa TaxID=1041015 RepID=A0A6P4E1E7_DRORH|nr:protein Hezron [Drosophila rhopaloa]
MNLTSGIGVSPHLIRYSAFISQPEKMSSLAPCFTVGSIVRCKTCFGENISGEVVAFDLGVKMLMMKCPSSKGGGDEQTIWKLTIVNISMCVDIEIVKEMLPMEDVQTPEPINIHMLQERLRMTTEQRSISYRSYHANASPFGQALFRVLVKHFGDAPVKWQNLGDNVGINILHQVVIVAPYGVENIRSDGCDPKLLPYVRRIVANFHNKQ